VSRNYTVVTIKTLFGQASQCAYPGCAEPLIFTDRGVTTVVAQIAHIRSESSNGPRHDPDFTGDLNGPDNLLLLCGTHHLPVDRHESIYPTADLLIWKHAQVQAAGTGTPISTDEAKRFVALAPEARAAMAEIARLTSRVERACKAAQEHAEQIEQAYDRALSEHRARFGPAWELNEDRSYARDGAGNRIDASRNLQMSPIEQQKWRAELDRAWLADRPAIEAAVARLDEEVNVLRMLDPKLGAAANRMLVYADAAEAAVGARSDLDQTIDNIRIALHDMWLVANPT